MADMTLRTVLREDVFTTSSEIRVDEEKGIIHGLKICGLKSDNGREYELAALKEAAPLYVGKPSYLNHRKGTERDVGDDIGYWLDVQVREDGLYGDLKYEKTHPYAPRLVERAKTMPKNIGFSHDADTEDKYVVVREGRTIITKITRVNSVDLVATPATTKGLSEGKTVAKTTVRKLIEDAGKKLSAVRQQWMTRLIEDDGLDVPMAAEVEAPTDPKSAMSDAFRAGMHAVVDQFCSGEIDLAQLKSQIGEFAKTHDKMAGPDEPEAPAEPVDEADEDEEEDDKKKDDAMKESRLARLEAKDQCRDLCESLNFIPTADQLEALIEIKTDKVRKATAQTFAAASTPTKPAGPRSRTAHAKINESRNGTTEKWEDSCLV